MYVRVFAFVRVWRTVCGQEKQVCLHSVHSYRVIKSKSIQLACFQSSLCSVIVLRNPFESDRWRDGGRRSSSFRYSTSENSCSAVRFLVHGRQKVTWCWRQSSNKINLSGSRQSDALPVQKLDSGNQKINAKMIKLIKIVPFQDEATEKWDWWSGRVLLHVYELWPACFGGTVRISWC